MEFFMEGNAFISVFLF